VATGSVGVNGLLLLKYEEILKKRDYFFTKIIPKELAKEILKRKQDHSGYRKFN
jgi:hypothetical protein